MVKGKVISFNFIFLMYFKIGIKYYEKGEVEFVIKRFMKVFEFDNKNVEIKFNLVGFLV